MLHVRLLGPFQFRHGDVTPPGFDMPRIQSLIAYLILRAGTPISRQALAFTFWPDSTDQQARTNLRQLLHRVRRAWPGIDHYLTVDDFTVCWRLDAPCTLDVRDFEESARSAAKAEQDADPVAICAALTDAVQRYTDNLLPDRYDDWIAPERERLRLLFLRSLVRLIALLENRRDYATAIQHSERLLRFDPLNEPTWRDLMRLHALAGNRTAALDVYKRCRANLRLELDIEPDPATNDLYQRLLAANDPAAPVWPELAPNAPTVPPLVGRQREWDDLLANWSQTCVGRAQLCVIAGEAGIGKTRLAEELLTWAGSQGFTIARSRSYAAAGGLAYAPIVDWLRTDALHAHLSRLDQTWLAEIGRLLPELRAAHPALPSLDPLTERWERQRLFEALARATLAAGKPTLLLLDDLQWCDRETIDWIGYLLHSAPTAPLLIAATLRIEELDANHSLTPLLNDLRRDDRLREIALGPLNPTETSTVASQLLGQQLDDRQSSQLFHETEGNPLFIVEGVHAGLLARPPSSPSRPNDSHPAILPPLVQSVLAARLAQSSPGARDLAGLAATIGRAFTLEILAAASSEPDASLAASLDELWKRRIVRAHSVSAYDFSHDKLRDAAYAGAGPARRRLLHHQVAGALERVHAADLDPVSSQLAHHYERAGLPVLALAHHQRAGEAAQRLYASDEAVRHFRSALSLLDALSSPGERAERELTLQILLGSSLISLQLYGSPESTAAYDRARQLSASLGLTLPAPVVRGLALQDIIRGAIHDGHAWGAQLLAQAEHDDDQMLAVEAHYLLGATAFWRGQFCASRSHLETALAAFDPSRRHSHIALYAQDPSVVCGIRFALTLWYLGYPDQARSLSSKALASAEQVGQPLSLVYALQFAAWILLESGDIETARPMLTQIHELSGALGLQEYGPLVASLYEGWIAVQQGAVNAGLTTMRQSLERIRDRYGGAGAYSFSCLLARAQMQAGELDEALAGVTEVSARFHQQGQHDQDAELHRIRGELLLAQGAPPDAAEVCFRTALATAQHQESRALELRAALSLSRLLHQQGRTPEAHHHLRETYDWFTEGFDTADLRAAGTLLNEISDRSSSLA